MTAPANDNFANAIVLTGSSGTVGPVTIDDATVETGEVHDGGGSTFQPGPGTIWYKFTAGDDSVVTLSTYGSLAGEPGSGDAEGYLDTYMIVYWATIENPTFAQLNRQAGNDDYTPGSGIPHDGDGEWWSYLSFSAVAGRSYWVQLGGEGNFYDYTGTILLTYTGIPFGPAPLVDLGDCPVEVVYQDVSAPNERFQPHAGDAGQFNDMTIDWYEPPHEAGDLLVFVGINTKLGLTVPAGYTEVFNDEWDDAPITPPIHGTHSTTIGPAWNQHCQQLIGYRIATASGGSDSVAAGSYGGFSYNDNGGAYYSNAMASNVYAFRLLRMGGDYPTVDDWPSPPVKVGPLNWEKYDLELGPDCDGNGDGTMDGDGACGDFYPNVDTPGPNIVSVSDVVADHPGNHIWMTIVERHGPILSDLGVSYPTTKQNSSMELFPGQKKTTGRPGLDTYGGMNAGVGASSGTGLNDHEAAAFLSSTDYFNPFRPYGSEDDSATTGLVGENGFVDTTFAPNFEVTGHVGTDWADGFIGIAGTNTGDHYVWDLLGGVAMQQVLIQGPEASRPSNDDLANAHVVPECPVTLAECVFGQTSEPGETYDGLGDIDLNNSVWFKWTPTTSETGVQIRTGIASSDPSLGDFAPFFTEYDTIIVVYDSSMTVIASDDDGDIGDLSKVTIDVTAGETYYIQVIGYGGDEGRLLLTFECRDQAVLAAPIWGWGGETGEGWHIVLGVPTG
jgi:hypothetical protein